MFNISIILFLAVYIWADFKFVHSYHTSRVMFSVIKSLLTYIVTVRIAHEIPFFEMYKSEALVPSHVVGLFVLLFLVVMCASFVVEKIGRRYVELRLKQTTYPMWFKLLVFCLVALASFLFFFAVWFRDYFGNLSPEQFIFNLQSPITGTADGMNMQIIFNPIFNSLSVMLVVGYILFAKQRLYRIYRKIPIGQKLFSKKRNVVYMTFALLSLSATFTFYLLKFDEVMTMYYTNSSYIEQNYVDIRKVKTTFPTQKRNLIHIYFESVENSYFDKSHGGYMDENLMPELLELTKEGVNFSGHAKLGGPYQTHGSSWSVAGFVNMMSGIPLKVATNGMTYGLDGTFLPGVYNLGDFLYDNGYEQTIMFGADAAFGGLDIYFKDHGKFNIFDWKYAQETGLIPQDYRVWWGFEDDKLYEYAKRELTRLAQTGKPFNFMMENADTHFPNGYMTDRTPKKYDSQYANVIAHSSSELVKLIRWIQQQDWYHNTTVVITGDHLSMDKEFFKNFKNDYQRTVFNVILNAPITTTHDKNRQFAPVDFYPTIIASLGIEIEGNRLGLGTNLFSGQPTLIERDTLSYFNKNLRANSSFYNREFLESHHR